MSRRWLRALLTAALCLLLAGCWNRREIETLGFVLATAIDWDADRGVYELTVQVAKPAALAPEAAGGERKAYHVFRGRGHTIFDANRNVTKQSPKKLWQGHLQVLIIGEAAARRGIQPVLDFYRRDGEARRLYWILVTRGRAGPMLMADVRSARIPAGAINDLMKVKGATSTAQGVRMHHFLKALAAPGQAATAGVIALAPGVTPGDGEQSPPEFHVEGTAVFVKDRLAGFLDSTETRGLLWVTAKVKSGIIIVPCPGQPEEKVGLEIIHADADVKPVWQGQGPAIEVKIREEGNIGDQNCARPLLSGKDFEALEKAKAEQIRAEVEAALRRARTLRADVFGFGTRISQGFPHEWERIKEKWPSLFQEIPIRVQVEAKMRQPGTQSQPTQVR